ncbi:MAG: malto-oligosyltrehalose synthase [Gemmatimonadota bacterium]|nr:malto-oligosyltrehalose synthase [Gemmatimonadota bacterium]
MAERALLATYRLQLTTDFGFAQARSLVPYLHALGISHVYCSPITRARPGSTHGYDVADPRELNPELGGEEAFRALGAELHAHGMGMLVDIVPNHMGTGDANPYWMDVLEKGQASRYAAWFDIDWLAPENRLRGRVLLPVLGASLRDVVARGELTLAYEGGRFMLRYLEQRFPVNPATLPAALRLATTDGDDTDVRELEDIAHGASTPHRLLSLLRKQAYRLAPWQKARRINYRRFFDINELIALRVEDPAVVAETHELILSLVGDGSVDGLRVDHVDGLLDPLAYLHHLRSAIGTLPLVVEKILSSGERLRDEWPVDGTTGYEFLNELESLFVSPSGRDRIDERYRALTRTRETFEETALRGKILMLRGALAPDVRRLTRLLLPIARREPAGGEISRARLGRAIVLLIACLPVYRSYLGEADERHRDDRRVIEVALQRALALGDADETALSWVAGVLLGAPVGGADRLRFAQRFQQVSGPATAKGVEDTALYRYVPLLSLNEVGGAPDRSLANAASALHAANAERAARWRRMLLATDTHDTKRGADVRARIDVLSEMPEAWAREVAKWRRLNRPHRQRIAGHAAPDASTEWMLYQTLVALWPLGKPDLPAIRDRVREYALKAIREAKRRTSWIEKNAAFEEGVTAFVDAILDSARSRPFLDAIGQFAARIAPAGFWNSLSAALIHATAPGIPDIYQGCELWSSSLVDPDNRRPVDFEQRRRLLDALPQKDATVTPEWCRDALARPEDGRLKLLVLHRSLLARRAEPALFSAGDYLPLAASGEREDHLFAFARVHERQAAIVVAPRLTLGLASGGGAPIGEAVWGDSSVMLPASLAGRQWRSALTGRELDVSRRQTFRVAELLADLPVAFLMCGDEGRRGGSVAS